MYYGDKEDDINQRFKLERNRQLYVLGVNPSTAQGIVAGKFNKASLDKTIERVEFFAKKAGYDSFVMLNVCAQRTSTPATLIKDDTLHNKNKQKIEEYLNGKEHIDVLLAFGNPIGSTKGWLFEYFKDIAEILKNHKAIFYVLNDPTKKTCLTSDGNPRHPSPKFPAEPLSDETELLKIDFNDPNNPLEEFPKWNFLK